MIMSENDEEEAIMKWLALILVSLNLMADNESEPRDEAKDLSAVRRGDKEDVVYVPKNPIVRCTKSMPPACYDADGKRVK